MPHKPPDRLTMLLTLAAIAAFLTAHWLANWVVSRWP